MVILLYKQLRQISIFRTPEDELNIKRKYWGLLSKWSGYGPQKNTPFIVIITMILYVPELISPLFT